MSNSVRSGKISVSKKAAGRLINDQAGEGLINSWREGIQNAIDSPGSSTISLRAHPKMSIIRDDGAGMDLLNAEDEELLTTFGETSKQREDDGTYGTFGLGFGQVLAAGAVIIVTRNSVVVFDFEDNFSATQLEERVPFDVFEQSEEKDRHPLGDVQGYNYKLAEIDETISGFMLMIHHYDSYVPDTDGRQWKKHMENIKDKFSHVPSVTNIEININGEELEPSPLIDTGNYLGDTKGFETEDAYFTLSSSIVDDISVYSRGIHICDIDGEGLRGKVVTKTNLDVNLSRNEIKSTDETWDSIRAEIEDTRVEILSEIPDSELYRNGRTAMLKRMVSNPQLRKQWSTKQIIPLANGSYTSLEAVTNAREIGFADEDNPLAHKLIEAGDPVLDQEKKEVTIIRSSSIELPPEFSVEKQIDKRGLNEDFELFPDCELKLWQRRQLAFARCLYDLCEDSLPGQKRDVFWGERNRSRAFTDCESFVALTDSTTRGNKKEVWMTEIRDVLVHELCHTRRQEKSGHPPEFSVQFRETLESPEVEKTFRKLVSEIASNGLTKTLRSYGYAPESLSSTPPETGTVLPESH